jgi:hypothetical protein
MSGNQKKRVVFETTGKNAADKEAGNPLDQTDHPKLMSVALLFFTGCTIAGYCVYEAIMFSGLLMDGKQVLMHSIFYEPIKWWVFLLALFLGLINLMDSADLALLGFGYRPWFADLQKSIVYSCKNDEEKQIHQNLVELRKSGAY